jgi:hypothetical protein
MLEPSAATAARGRLHAVALASALALAACRPTAVATAPAVAPGGREPAVRLLAHAVVPTGTRLGPHEVGGLSGLVYDRRDDLFYAVVDDPNGHPPPRLLRLRWHPPAAPELLGWVTLTVGGGPLPGEGADLEGVARRADGELFVSSEGDAEDGLGPWVARFSAAGELRERLPLPAAFEPRAEHGAQQNRGFEALALEPGEGTLLAGTEGPLVQDEPAPAGEPARSRLLRWDLGAAGDPRQWLYPLDPPHAPAPAPDKVRVAGLVEIVPFPPGPHGGHLLALERSFVADVGFAVKLYEATLDGAEEVTGAEALAGRPVRTVRKRLLADLGALGVPMDNYEGMAWGPAGEDGQPLLVVISDNNFNPAEQTYLLALRLAP